MVKFSLLALAAVASATPIQDLAPRDSSSFCSAVSYYITHYTNSASASSFCSSFESIKTSTITLTSTIVASQTQVTTTTSTTTIVPTTSVSVAATCTSTSAPKVRRGSTTTSGAVATSTSCSSFPNSFYPCGYKGTLSSAQKISTPSGCGSVELCRSACFGNSNCLSFSFDTSNNCQHYGNSVFYMGLTPNPGSSLAFYEKSCFSCTTTTTTAKSTTTTTAKTTSTTTSWPIASTLLSSACSCLNINPSPVTTATVTVSTQTTVATNTITATATATASSTSTVTTTTTTLSFYSTSTVTATDGDTYNVYPSQDFFGYNLYSGYCGSPDGVVDTPYGNFSCTSFNDCVSICSAYNDAAASDIANSSAQACLGVTEHQSIPYCYLKYAVPGNGAPNCQVVGDSSDDISALLVSKH